MLCRFWIPYPEMTNFTTSILSIHRDQMHKIERYLQPETQDSIRERIEKLRTVRHHFSTQVFDAA